MKRLLCLAGVLLAVPAAALAAAPKPDRYPPRRGGKFCISRQGRGVLFTVRMGERAGRAVYAGTRRVRSSERWMLRRIERCQRNPAATPFVRRFDAARRAAHAARVQAARAAAASVWHGPAVASWYDDSGTTGCGFHAVDGVATFVVPCGGHVTLRGPGGTVTATRDDSGPYVAGRMFDLDPATKAALGCSDLCTVYYR